MFLVFWAAPLLLFLLLVFFLFSIPSFAFFCSAVFLLEVVASVANFFNLVRGFAAGVLLVDVFVVGTFVAGTLAVDFALVVTFVASVSAAFLVFRVLVVVLGR